MVRSAKFRWDRSSSTPFDRTLMFGTPSTEAVAMKGIVPPMLYPPPVSVYTTCACSTTATSVACWAACNEVSTRTISRARSTRLATLDARNPGFSVKKMSYSPASRFGTA